MSMTPEQQQLHNFVFTSAPPLYSGDFPAMFFWSPKSGCTSLIKWFYFQLGILNEALDYDPWIHTYRMEVFQKQQDYMRNAILTLQYSKEKEVYKLVRNPYTRAVSSYLYAFSFDPAMSSVAPEALNGSISFKEFLYKVKNTKPGTIDTHISKQYIRNEEAYITRYIRLENFASEISAIEKSHGLVESPLDEITKSHHHNTNRITPGIHRSFADVKLSKETLKNMSLPNYRYFYDEETKELVQELFAEDFRTYGYSLTDL